MASGPASSAPPSGLYAVAVSPEALDSADGTARSGAQRFQFPHLRGFFRPERSRPRRTTSRFSAEDLRAVTEDTSLTTGGALTIRDADAGEAGVVAQVQTAGAYGAFSIGSTGAWSYALDNGNAAVQALAGATLAETFTVCLDLLPRDRHRHHQWYQRCSAAGRNGRRFGKRGRRSHGNRLADHRRYRYRPVELHCPGRRGCHPWQILGRCLRAMGLHARQWRSGQQALGAGSTLTDSFVVTAFDGTATETVTVTIDGTNDVPLLAGTVAGSVTEDGVSPRAVC